MYADYYFSQTTFTGVSLFCIYFFIHFFRTVQNGDTIKWSLSHCPVGESRVFRQLRSKFTDLIVHTYQPYPAEFSQCVSVYLCLIKSTFPHQNVTSIACETDLTTCPFLQTITFFLTAI